MKIAAAFQNYTLNAKSIFNGITSYRRNDFNDNDDNKKQKHPQSIAHTEIRTEKKKKKKKTHTHRERKLDNICLQMTCHTFIWLHDWNNERKLLYRKQISSRMHSCWVSGFSQISQHEQCQAKSTTRHSHHFTIIFERTKEWTSDDDGDWATEREWNIFVVQLKSIGNVVCENPPEKLEVRDISAQWNTIMVHAKHLSHNDTIYQSGVKCNKFSLYTSGLSSLHF